MSEGRLTEEQVGEVLDRAAKLDDSDEGIGAEDLIEAGVEAGYSRNAMERAIQETQALEARSVPPVEEPGIIQPLLKSGAVGSLAGGGTALGYALPANALVGVTVFGGVPLLILLAVHLGSRRAHRLFQLGNVGYWTGYLVALSLLSPSTDMGYFVVLVSMLVALLALIGVGVVEGRWRIGGASDS